MRVPVENAASWSAGSPGIFVNGPFFDAGGSAGGAAYDISPDGQRFLLIKVGGGPEQSVPVPNLVIVQNWDQELKRLVPTR